MKKLILSNVIFILSLVFLISCKEYKNTLSTRLINTNLPVELVYYKDFNDDDSLMIGINVPQKLKVSIVLIRF